jgi:2-keto-4-pentenoate hydratase/2-oxohepta-3-ene-1,7-dioic acid hydratase in catechol pathway
VAINYPSHGKEAKEVGDLDFPEIPMIFGRWASTLVPDGTPVPVPANEGLDWEVELAAVIGKEGWLVEEADAPDHVLGYTAFNDLTARGKQTDSLQFTLGKNADRSGPIGPVLVTPDELDDVSNLHLRTRVNGATVQDGSTSEMFHSIPRLIAYISDTVTLLPGDVIATGTPAGVGAAMQPPRSLSPGDVVEVEVEGIGTLRNPIVRREQP